MNARILSLAALAALSLVALGCGGGRTETASTPTPAATPAPAATAAPAAPMMDATAATPVADTTTVLTPADEAATVAILATADLADGTADKVVSKCAGCRLGMDGKAEHSVQAHGYTLHFCSETCKSIAEPKLGEVISALK